MQGRAREEAAGTMSKVALAIQAECDTVRFHRGSLDLEFLKNSVCERCGVQVAHHDWVDMDPNGFIEWCSIAETK